VTVAPGRTWGSALPARPIGETIGFGASGIGSLTWDVPEDTAQQVLGEAWDAGLRYYDTSPLYGYGLSELRLGRFLRDRPRESYLLSTKVGRYFVPPRPGAPLRTGGWARPQPLVPVLDYSYDGVMRSLEQSHNRLGVSAIDIVFIHDLDRRNLGVDFDTHYRTAVEGGYRALDELRSAGVVKAIGAGINEADVAADLLRDVGLDVVMLAGRYTLLEQPALDTFLPLAVHRGVDVIAVGVFNSGILVKAPGAGATYDYGPAPADVVARARAIEAECRAFGVPMPAAAIQFPLAHPAVKTVLVGMSRPGAVAQNMNWLQTPVPPALWERLRDRGLIARDVPTP